MQTIALTRLLDTLPPDLAPIVGHIIASDARLEPALKAATWSIILRRTPCTDEATRIAQAAIKLRHYMPLLASQPDLRPDAQAAAHIIDSARASGALPIAEALIDHLLKRAP